MSNITIRSATPRDAAELLNLYEYYVLNTAITYEVSVPSEEEFAGRIRDTLKKYPYLVLLEDGQIKGYAYAGPFKGRECYNWSAETTIYLAKDAHGRGYGRMLYAKLEEKLAEMGVRNAYACIADPETEDEYLTRNSEEFHGHIGYVKVGTFTKCANKFGRWYNMIWMEKMLGDHGENPAPVSFGGSK